MSEVELPPIPQAVLDLIDQEQYKEDSTFEIHHSFVHNTCAAVQNGNPLFWDKDVAQEITAGPIAPPTMLSVWFRPHVWSPGAEGEQKALQTHFDLKELMDLPEAIIAGNEMVFGEPVRMGDTLTTYQVIRSVSDVKTTRVGTGRFWNIDVVSVNQHGDMVGTDTYSCFGYRRAK